MPGHDFLTRLRWTGNRGTGTSAYPAYDRTHVLSAPRKPDLPGSSDVRFRGEADRWNPEELLVGALSACHMLWYLHLCAVEGIRVVAYEDEATGHLELARDGPGRFTEATLRPRVVLASGDPVRAAALHEEAHRRCFIAASVNFPVRLAPVPVELAPPAGTGPTEPHGIYTPPKE
ncbi:MAG: OsmC family protein [Thermoplasmata archaeon]